MGVISEIKTIKTSWINITNASDKEINYLAKKFKFNQLDLDDSYPRKKSQRPKIFFRNNYIFLVLLFPRFNKKKKEVYASEIDIFITKNYLITIQRRKKGRINDIFSQCQKDKKIRKQCLNKNPFFLLYFILDQLYQAVFPMLDKISLNLDKLKDLIFTGKTEDIAQKIFIEKRNIMNLKKSVQVHKSILRKLIDNNKLFTKNKKLAIYFHDLVDYTKNIWDTLDIYQQTINALEASNNSISNYKTNDLIRILTMLSSTILPLALLAAIFTMSVENMPISGIAYDWHVLVAMMTIIVIGLLIFFKRKKWI